VLLWDGVAHQQLLEARVFRSPRRLRREDLSIDLLLSLGLECLTGAARDNVFAHLLPPGDSFGLLLGAASGGGCYGPALEGAYGRLAAWQSCAALVGVPDETPVEEVAAQVQRTTWVSFSANTGWFYNILDLGLVALRPDGRSLAVLAATDSD
jgi:hypothetical protein